MKALLAAFALVLIVDGAVAQTVSIATTPPGSYTNSVGAAVAKTIVDRAKLRAIVQPQATIGFDEVDSGGAEFNVSNAFDAAFYAAGTGEYEGRGPKPNLRMVAALIPFRVALHARADSPVHTIADLKGRRLSSGFNAQKTVGRIIEAHLANAGLTYNDVGKVPVPNVAGASQDFISGKVDALYFALGSGSGKQAAASVGGLRVLEIDDAAEAVARLQMLLPGAYVMRVEPAPGLDGLSKPTRVVAFDLVLNTSAKVSDDVIYRVTKALHEGQGDLAATFAPFQMFSPQLMAKPLAGVPMHPGAIRFYQEVGLWPPKP